MNYVKITKNDVANGPGVRVVLWVAGCSHECPGCHNPETWDPESGENFGFEEVYDILRLIDQPHIAGLTLSGGDPLFPQNRKEMTRLCEKVKRLFPQKTIWCYTGFLWEDVHQDPIIKYIDVLVDGEYKADKRNISLPYCGSENQRVIDVQKSIKNGKVILWEGGT